MISTEGKHYLYRHIRKDKDEPFYIGVGTKLAKILNSKTNNKITAIYRRAFSKNKRCPIWHNIIAKTDYEVEILLESDDYEFILSKEKEFVKLYGRINLKTGTLANLTDGGEGTLGFVMSQEQKDKTLKTRASRIYKRRPNCKIIYQYNELGEFIKKHESIKEAAVDSGIRRQDIQAALYRMNGKSGGFVWLREHRGDTIKITKNIGNKTHTYEYINMIDPHTLSILRRFESLVEINNFFDGKKVGPNINRACRTGQMCSGYLWKYSDEEINLQSRYRGAELILNSKVLTLVDISKDREEEFKTQLLEFCREFEDNKDDSK